VKDVQIDGPYGHYEFSFDVDAARVGTYALIRLSTPDLKLPASEDENTPSALLPDIVVPVIIFRRLAEVVSWVAASFACIVGFISAAQWLPEVGVDPKSAMGTFIQAVFFWLILFFTNKAGLGELAKHLGKKG
jgi:hypothetical protein